MPRPLPPDREATGLRLILVFLLRFLLLAAVFGSVWRFAIFHPYNRLLVLEARLVAPQGAGAVFHEEKGEIEIVQLIPGAPDRSVATLFLGTLHFNLIPFLALLFATPGVRLRRALLFLPLGLFILALSHLVHMYLDVYKFTSADVVLSSLHPWRSFFAYYGKKIMLLGQAFWEQAGSMIMPFFLWLLFCGSEARQLLGVVALTPASPSAPPPVERQAEPRSDEDPSD